MEFPDLGQNCSVSHCNQLDFLPFTCSNCKLVFCKIHHITSEHDCKCLNVFFERHESHEPVIKYKCNMAGCKASSHLELLCKVCQLHFCLGHRHHGCLDELPNSEQKKLKVQQWKRPKQQFQTAKSEADKKIEQTLRKAEQVPVQKNLANKLRIMKLKGKAIGENKIPTTNRIYFSVQPPVLNVSTDYKPNPLFTSIEWTVGRTIDLFSKRMKIENKNNEPDAPKLRLFKLSDGLMISSDMSATIKQLIDSNVIQNGDSLILEYIKNDEINEEFFSAENLLKFQSAIV